MDWLGSIRAAIDFMEAQLTEDITVDDVASHVYASGAHFGRLFNIVTGVSLYEYIRARRLSLAGQELARGGVRVIDVAMKYRYDTAESFSKAFSRFHGCAPSEVKHNRSLLKYYHPLDVSVTIKGGFTVPNRFMDAFCWSNDAGSAQNAKAAYQSIVGWAGNARGHNPLVFDELTEWILDDAEWTDNLLARNEQILMRGVFARFLAQNKQLRERLNELKPSGCVNQAVFTALDRFDAALTGHIQNDSLQQTVADVFADFERMKNRSVRVLFAGGKTGAEGVNAVSVYGFVNELKDLDARVQWALFMPDVVSAQQKGFKVDLFEYVRLPGMRFIGRAISQAEDNNARKAIFDALDQLREYQIDYSHDVLLAHHNGRNVDIEPWHGFYGRFMKPETPVPQGMMHVDFVPASDGQAGPPYLSQFAYATYVGDMKALHSQEGFDSDAMYDVTRNIILGQGICIPYPHKYWTAEVFPQGIDHDSSAYMFCVDLG